METSSKLKSPSVEEVGLAIQYIRKHFQLRKTKNTKIGSAYDIKGRAEKETGAYIPEGAFIQAAKKLGYKVFPPRGKWTGYYFNFSVIKTR